MTTNDQPTAQTDSESAEGQWEYERTVDLSGYLILQDGKPKFGSSPYEYETKRAVEALNTLQSALREAEAERDRYRDLAGEYGSAHENVLHVDQDSYRQRIAERDRYREALEAIERIGHLESRRLAWTALTPETKEV